MAKLDVMASPRPIYLSYPAWLAQDVQEVASWFARRWCEQKTEGCLEQVVLFLHHHIVTSATAARRCLCLFKAVLWG